MSSLKSPSCLPFCLMMFCNLLFFGNLLLARNLGTESIIYKNILDTLPTNLNPLQLKQYAQQVNSNSQELSDKINATNQKELETLKKQEAKLFKKLSKTDSLAAKKLFNSSNSRLEKLQTQIQSNTSKLSSLSGSNAFKEYIPLMDTLKTSMQFLKTKSTNLPLQAEANKAMGSLNGLQTQFANSTAIKTYITQRNQELTTAFNKVGMSKQLTGYKEQAYYYKQQIQEYKEQAQDPHKLEETAISTLNKLPLFQQFMQKNSQLASLFPTPDNYGTPQALAGLQTRASIQQLLQSKFGASASSLQGMGQGCCVLQ